MNLQQIGKRLDAAEATLSNEIATCRVCEICATWPNLLIRIEGMPDAWPEEPACSSCGRVPLQVVRIGQREDGPQ